MLLNKLSWFSIESIALTYCLKTRTHAYANNHEPAELTVYFWHFPLIN